MSTKNPTDTEKHYNYNSIPDNSRDLSKGKKQGKPFYYKRISFYTYGLIVLSITTYLILNKLHQQNKTELLFFDSTESFSDNSDDDSFQLRHIYHHNPLESKAARLDITNKFIIEHGLDSPQEYTSPFKIFEEDIKDLGVPDIDSNIPISFKTHSQWTHQFKLKSNNINTIRLLDRSPDSIESYLDYAFEVGQEEVNKISLDWTEELVSIPNVSDRDTVLNLALMASNAYVNIPETGDWKDLDENSPYNETKGFGWLGDGIRGHIFANNDNSSVIISIKGTSATGLNSGSDSETSPNDKINDNLLFSCCCARVSYMWSTVCDCYEDSYTCNQRCLERELQRQDRYYKSVLQLYRNVTYMYPNTKNIWVTGHSLGGALSSLLGRTFGLPAVTFEAPAELLATRRLHLPMPPGLSPEMEHIWHFGNTADPIFMGVCNGASSTCSVAGYAMETQCHTGKKCVYDVVSDLGWHVNLLNHRIHTVIDDIILQYNDTPVCEPVVPCHDCFNWNFVDNENNGRKKLSSSSSSSSTRTSTNTANPTYPGDNRKCLKRTWYGRCYQWEDDDDTSSSSSRNYYDKTTKLSFESSIFNTTLKTSTITKTKNEKIKTSSTLSSTSTSSDLPTHKCVSYSWLGYCLKYDDDDDDDDDSITSSSPPPFISTTTSSIGEGKKCIEYTWYGTCKKYESN